MSKRTDRKLRLKLFRHGNTQCPICLTPFTSMQVEFGKKVTLEHAPPEALGGKVACLTCSDCNNGASRLDHAAKMAQKARDDHVFGRGTRVEVDFFGAGITSGYLRPKDDEMAARLARQPVPTSIRQLRGGVMQLRRLPPLGAGLDEKKGIRFRIKRPNSHHVAVSWLRSAYLLVFSLLGREGYRYAQSPALQPVREQIMNPDEVRIKGSLSGEVSGVDFPVDPVILLNPGHELPCWAVKMGDKSVILPCGGSIDRFRQLTREPIDVPVKNDRVGLWASRQFRNGNGDVISFAINREADDADIDFIGARLEIQTESGDVWEWIIVDYQSNQVIALPLRAKGDEQDGSLGVIMMLDKDQYLGLGRTDRSKFTAAKPTKLLSLTVDRSTAPSFPLAPSVYTLPHEHKSASVAQKKRAARDTTD